MHHTQTAEGTTGTDLRWTTSSMPTDLSRNLDSSFLSVDERGNIIPKTPEVALVAAQAYLFTTQPTPEDP
jgi:hypothetical protein